MCASGPGLATERLVAEQADELGAANTGGFAVRHHDADFDFFPVGRNDDGSAALLRQLEVRAELLERPEQLFWANRRQLGHRGPY